MRVAGDFLTLPAKSFRAPDLLGGGNGRLNWGGVLVSILSFLIGFTKIRELAILDGAPEAGATRVSTLVAVYPFSLFFSAPYSEALCLLLMAAAVLA
jgi:hypothetical protein